MFEMTNYKGAPFTVACFWSMKTALRFGCGSQQSWLTEVVEPSSDALDYDLCSAAKVSVLVSILHSNFPGLQALRHLLSFQKGTVNIRLAEFILASVDGGLVVGQVVEIVEAFTIGASVIRIRLDNAREVNAVDTERGGVLSVPAAQVCKACAPICVESAAMCELHAWLEGGMYTFTY